PSSVARSPRSSPPSGSSSSSSRSWWQRPGSCSWTAPTQNADELVRKPTPRPVVTDVTSAGGPSPAERTFEHLAHVIAGQGLDQVQAAGPFVRRQLCRDQIGQLLQGRWCGGGRDRPGPDTLAEVRSGLPADRDPGHTRMCQQDVLDLSGTDLVPAALDEVGALASDEPHGTVGLTHRHVPGTEPTVGGHRLEGGIGTIQVPTEQVRTPHLDLPHGFRGSRGQGTAVIIDQPQLHPVQWGTHAPGT